MATITMASIAGSGGYFSTSLPETLDVSPFAFGYTANPGGADSGFFRSGTMNGLGPAILSFSGEGFGSDPATGALTGTVTAASFAVPYIHSSLPQFSITGLSISLAALFTGQADVMTLLTGGNDTIIGSAANDAIHAGLGNDRVSGSAGDDIVHGGEGNDFINGGAGNDQLFGDAGNDTLYGASGNNMLLGGEGSDRYVGGAGQDSFYDEGTSGVDTADYRNSTAGVTVNLLSGTGSGGFAEGDTYFGIERVFGSAFNDVITGSHMTDWLYGFDGNDRFYGLSGHDRIWGGNGNDVAFGGDGNDVIYGQAGNDYLVGDNGNDRLFGGDGNDWLIGGAGADILFGDAGDDIMKGGAGNDFLVLGAGNDGLWLGAGNDIVRFDYGNGQDTIFDFVSGEDKIDFTHTDMTLAALQANTIETDAGLLMTLGSGSILLAGLDLAEINWQTDFMFA